MTLDAAALAAPELPMRAAPTRVLAAATGPGHWQFPSFDDRGWLPTTNRVAPMPAPASVAAGGAAPAAPPAGADPSTTSVEMGAGSCLYTRTTFDLEQPRAARVMELRITYQDGFVAYLNGQEVARRNVPASPPGARPLVAHGPETERIYVPVTAAWSTLLTARGNVLAVEIRPAIGRAANGSRAPAGQVGLAVFAGVRIVRGPYLVAPGDGTVSLAWETDLPARGGVTVSLADQPSGSATRPVRFAAPLPSLRQVVKLAPLAAGKRYRYQVEVETAAHRGDRARSPSASFSTAPAPAQPMRFAVYGDMRAPGHDAHAQVVAGLLREQPALVLNTGDLVAVGSEESAWQRYFEITAALGAVAPVAPALGNHDAYRDGAAKSWALFGLRSAAPRTSRATYASFDWGGAHFLLLDTNQPQPEQRAWMVRDLAAARKRGARGIFAFCHDGPWSHGTHGGSASVERDFAPLLADGGVDVLFSGHDHLYERGTGITSRGPLTYVVTGGGGAPLYNPTCEPARPAAPSRPAAASPAPAPGVARSPLPPCPPSVAALQKTHHYLLVELNDRRINVCPRLPDGQPVEACIELPVRARGP